MSSCAIMQPYFFPSIQYFQLIDSVDNFIIYDDCNMKKKSFITRNNLFYNKNIDDGGQPIIIKISKLSQNKQINEHLIHYDQNYLEIIDRNLKQFKFYNEVKLILNSIISITKGTKKLSEFLGNSIYIIMQYLLDSNKNYIYSSSIFYNKISSAEEKIIEIAQLSNCNIYINSIGGTKLYSKENFKKKNIQLFFLNTKIDSQFIQVSILSTIARLGIKNTKNLIKEYNLK